MSCKLKFVSFSIHIRWFILLSIWHTSVRWKKIIQFSWQFYWIVIGIVTTWVEPGLIFIHCSLSWTDWRVVEYQVSYFSWNNWWCPLIFPVTVFFFVVSCCPTGSCTICCIPFTVLLFLCLAAVVWYLYKSGKFPRYQLKYYCIRLCGKNTHILYILIQFWHTIIQEYTGHKEREAGGPNNMQPIWND